MKSMNNMTSVYKCCFKSRNGGGIIWGNIFAGPMAMTVFDFFSSDIVQPARMSVLQVFSKNIIQRKRFSGKNWHTLYPHIADRCMNIWANYNNLRKPQNIYIRLYLLVIFPKHLVSDSGRPEKSSNKLKCFTWAFTCMLVWGIESLEQTLQLLEYQDDMELGKWVNGELGGWASSVDSKTQISLLKSL